MLSTLEHTTLGKIPVDLVPTILKYIARENDLPVIAVLIDLRLVSPEQVNTYWFATCREITGRPWLPHLADVNYEWVYRILTSASNGACRQFVPDPCRGYGLDERFYDKICSGCFRQSLRFNRLKHHVMFETRGSSVRLLHCFGSSASARPKKCSEFGCIAQTLIALWTSNLDKRTATSTLKYCFNKFSAYFLYKNLEQRRVRQRWRQQGQQSDNCAYADTLAYLIGVYDELDDLISVLNEICLPTNHC